MQWICQPNQILHIVEPHYTNQPPADPEIHYIDKFPLKVSGNSSVFRAHRAENCEQPFSGPVKKLTFAQLGSYEIPNLRPYRSTCEVVEFRGKIYSGRSVFEVTHQLPNVTNVDIVIDSAQATYTEEPSKYFFRTPLCPQVKSLKITMNLDYFNKHTEHQYANNTCLMCDNNDYGGFCDVQSSLTLFAESLLRNAGDSFPNLKDLLVELPEDDRLYNAVHSLINMCPDLREKTYTALQQNELPGASATAEEQFQTADMEYFSGSEYIPWNHNDHTLENPMISSTQFWPYYHHNSHNADVNIETSEQEVIPSFSYLPSTYLPANTPEVNHRPPPGFAPLLPCQNSEQLSYAYPSWETTEEENIDQVTG